MGEISPINGNGHPQIRRPPSPTSLLQVESNRLSPGLTEEWHREFFQTTVRAESLNWVSALDVRPEASLQIGGLSFVPVNGDLFEHVKPAMDHVLDLGEYEVEAMWGHVFSRARADAPLRRHYLSNLDGPIAPRVIAADLLAALTAYLNGAETGTVETYEKVKVQMDGIAAVSLYRAYDEVIGPFAYENQAMYFVTVSTEGSSKHRKPGEPVFGNPCIPIGETFPLKGYLVEHGRKFANDFATAGFVPCLEGALSENLTTLYKGHDAVEGTLIAATTPEAYRRMYGKEKDNGALCESFVADCWGVSPDTYAEVILISPKMKKLLFEKDIKIPKDASIFQIISLLAQAKGGQICDVAGGSLGPKFKYVDKEGNDLEKPKADRSYLIDYLQSIRDYGVQKLLTVDDGTTSLVISMVNEAEVAFEDGSRGPVDFLFGPSGVFEAKTGAAVTQDQDGIAYWRYIDKEAAKRDYGERGDIPEAQLREYRQYGIENSAQMRDIEEDVPPETARIFSVVGITDNPLNPHLMAPVVDPETGAAVLTGQYFTAAGESVAFAVRLKPRKSFESSRTALYPVLPMLMKLPDEEFEREFQRIVGAPDLFPIFARQLKTYLSWFVENNFQQGAPYLLQEEHLRERQATLNSETVLAEDIRAIRLLERVVQHAPELFVNPQALSG